MPLPHPYSSRSICRFHTLLLLVLLPTSLPLSLFLSLSAVLWDCQAPPLPDPVQPT